MAQQPSPPHRSPLSTDARAIAIEVLRRVDQEGAWANRTLDAELRRRGVAGRDAALAAEIVYGVLRVLPSLDALIAARLKRGGRVDALTRAALRVGAYQLQHLSRVPPHAAVNACVKPVRAERGARVAGFVNAVLRGLAKDRPSEPHPPTHVELPPWLATSLERSLGAERAQALMSARPLPPPLDLRVSAGRSKEAVLRRLCEGGDRSHALGARDAVDAADTDAMPPMQPMNASSLSVGAALRVTRAGDPRALPGFSEGDFVVQEVGSQWIGALLGAQPGEHVADVCAGRGGKTLQLAEAVGPTGEVTALELHEARLEQIPDALAKVGCDTPLELVCADLQVGCAGLEGRFDRVLVDAPCTGAGTFHRRPELLLRLTPDAPERLADVQRAILRNAAKLVREGGQLVYAVCSPLDEEGAGVVAEAESMGLRAHPFGPADRVEADPDGAVRIGPWSAGVDSSADAYQVFRFIR